MGKNQTLAWVPWVTRFDFPARRSVLEWDLPMGEKLSGCRVKGTIVRSHLEWARQKLGDACAKDIAARLDGESAALLGDGILESQWIPFRALVAIDRAIAELAGGNPAQVWEELGRYSARSNLTTTYKAFARSGPESFLRHEARQRLQFLDFGQAQVESSLPRRFRVIISDAKCFSPVFCHSALGYYRQALELMGVPDVKVTHPQCQCRGDRHCLFEIAWN